ncbi:MAG: hypothetical protein A2287_07995 [Candidatus Melainabacteria bacterium RIFOXYA12_FULL_32_12]|nr:MAG: hypothetical protein A2255_08915 [Candidatus Melainabacteria bacterium RIFOXYA2_FULL_32_9]OGI25928.1 MAG: hypothetical protein A2287_07995 [Candidatus Melainabacteria bacterium RIFOXYA12_FULL_32_12]
MSLNNLIKPQKLNPGDTIGIISPAGAVKETKLWQPTIEYFEKRGYAVKIAPHALNQEAYLAGSDESRLFDLISFFEDPEIKAIICSRGGYGTFRLLQDINYEIIRNNPKIFVGYSDITALLWSFLEKTGLITFHGPLALSDFGTSKINNYTETSFFEVLEGKAEIPHIYSNPINYECINPGDADGELLAGNLAIITGLLGTPYFPDMTEKILLLEDIGEPLYKIDRMLMQLKLAGVFDKISGLLFGEFTNIVQSDSTEANKLSPIDVIKTITNDIDIPIGYGFSASHGEYKATLPLGVKYYFNSQKFNLVINEKYIS